MDEVSMDIARNGVLSFRFQLPIITKAEYFLSSVLIFQILDVHVQPPPASHTGAAAGVKCSCTSGFPCEHVHLPADQDDVLSAPHNLNMQSNLSCITMVGEVVC